MQINEVIRKYRKENNLTQEEMAVRLGVTAPAVNKWESGASMPDVSLLAPIARLLNISLDELLSFKEELSDVEIRNILAEIQTMFMTEPIGAVHKKMQEYIREYPNAEELILSFAAIMYGRCCMLAPDEGTKYENWIKDCYKNLLTSDDERIRHRAADGMYALYIGREQFEEAERCLEYYSPDDPDRPRKLATIYYGTGRYEEAYKTLEGTLYTDYQKMSVGLHQIYRVAMNTGDHKKAEAILNKESELADLFEMGEYHKNAGRFDYVVATKNAEETLKILDILMAHSENLTDYRKSSLFEHVTFAEGEPGFADVMRMNLFNQVCNDDSYAFVRESDGWEEFKKKWS